jgi:hypothetical protein
MKKTKILALLCGLFLVGAAEAHYDAHYRDYHNGTGFHGHRGSGRINAEQWRQRQRIENGLERGHLSPREYAQLARQQRHIARVEQHFKRDGRLDWRERQILKEKLARASEDIRDFKQNGRYQRGGRFYR